MTAALSLGETERRQRRVFGISCFSAVIEEIGREGFADRLLDFLDCTVGADHCAIFQLRDHELTEVGSACHSGAAAMSKSDLTPYDVKRQQSQTRLPSARVDVCNIADANEARLDGLHKRQRIMICAQKPKAFYCLRILRLAHRGRIPDGKMDHLREIADLLVSLVAQHIELQVRKPNLTPALTSLDEIQECISSATDLSRREGEVCARILYGYSSCGIALDLGIGKETVMTYRKRSYQRLGIGSQRELLMWYLALWSALRGRTGANDVDLLTHTELNSRIRSKLPRVAAIPAVPALA
jgi:DNA-binding CsgD family transcriptional regulator